MAKLLLTVTVIFFAIALAHARDPLDFPANDVVSRNLPASAKESDEKTTTTATLLLPSERLSKRESESATGEDFEVPQKTKSETDEFVPLTVINLRPISRQFPQRPWFMLRPRRPCRHHHLGKPWGPIQIHHREVPYGNDMLMAGGGYDDKENTQNPTRWVRFHHGDTNGPRFPSLRDNGLAVGAEEFKGPGHFRHHHHHHHHHHHGEGDEMEREGHEHHHGFLMKIRKFLNHF